jgi:hypothetical protein
MFNSSYGGIESDGMLHGIRQEQPEPQEPKATEAMAQTKRGLIGSSFLKNIQTDDLILLGIALLLLLDGEGDGDFLIFIIAALIFLF